MSKIRTHDLNKSVVEKELWNRQEHVIRLISYYQVMINQADMNRDLFGMYQGLQGLLDQITPDFEEVKRIDDKTVVVKGMMTKKFSTYRTILDTGNRQYNISLDPSIDRNVTGQLRNRAYQNFQRLKYNLIQECERLGYNAKKTDAADVYREGNN